MHRPLFWRGLCLGACLAAQPLAAADCTEDAMIVFDGSGSMSEMGFNQLDEPRILDARRAMRQVLPRVDHLRDIGLVTYGPGLSAPCENVRLRFGPQPDAAEAILDVLNRMHPNGSTPLTAAVGHAADVLTEKAPRGIVVLVTDGKETCGGAPCVLAATLAAERPGLTVHVIGFRIRGDRFAWQSQGPSDYSDATTVARCLAERTGGLYTNTETLEELIGALQQTLGCPLFSARDPRRAG